VADTVTVRPVSGMCPLRNSAGAQLPSFVILWFSVLLHDDAEWRNYIRHTFMWREPNIVVQWTSIPALCTRKCWVQTLAQMPVIFTETYFFSVTTDKCRNIINLGVAIFIRCSFQLVVHWVSCPWTLHSSTYQTWSNRAKWQTMNIVRCVTTPVSLYECLKRRVCVPWSVLLQIW